MRIPTWTRRYVRWRRTCYGAALRFVAPRPPINPQRPNQSQLRLVRSMTGRLCLVVSTTALLIGACATFDPLQFGDLRDLNLSIRDAKEVRTLLMNRPDIRRPLWGFYRAD